MLKVRAAPLIDRHDGPSIGQGAHLDISRIDHRLDGKDQTGTQLQALPGLSHIRHLWVLVHFASDPVADQVSDDSVPGLFRDRLDGVADIAQEVSGYGLRDPCVEGLARDIQQALACVVDLAYGKRPGRISVPAVEADADI